jgi:hypothetical protein
MTAMTRVLAVCAVLWPGVAVAQFNPAEIPIEVQAWWGNPAVGGLPFGHIHAAIALPIGQTVSGVLQREVRIVLHDNPSPVYRLRIRDDRGNIYVDQALTFTCPFDGVTSTNCAMSVPVTINTAARRADGTIRAPDGWRALRLEVQADSADPNIFIYETSSIIPLQFQNGAPRADFRDDSGLVTRFEGMGLYGEIYPAVGVIENAPTAPVSGTYVFQVRTHNPRGNPSRFLQVALDKSHRIPATGAWPEEPPSTGQILLEDSVPVGSSDIPLRVVRDIAVDTTKLTNGWHSLAVRSEGQRDEASTCSYCAGLPDQFNSGVAKIWFYVQNGTSSPPTPTPQLSMPVISPSSTTFQNSQHVTITHGDASAFVTYTLDGSTPTEASSHYHGGFSVTRTTTVKARAFKAGVVSSDVAVQVYTQVVCSCTPVP